MSEAKITDLTVKDTGNGARVTVVVEGPRPDFADLQLLMDGKQVTLLLGPVATRPQPSPQVDVHPLIHFVGTIGSALDPNRRDEYGVAVNVSTTRPVQLSDITLTPDDSDANVTRYYLDIR
ncbi:hypothetical protein [Kitasatospora herbaricolor]|uniref:Uncharacterized protein n=1 Tax=Kitasatospora herbaricolor TaxID=68217 RepID=A0ABZ1WLR3_9ACTN|nr:hypothetical protein [Kitasatospora herbaricolor]